MLDKIKNMLVTYGFRLTESEKEIVAVKKDSIGEIQHKVDIDKVNKTYEVYQDCKLLIKGEWF
jgi:hypothetical protein